MREIKKGPLPVFFTYGKRLNIPSLSPIELKVKTTFFGIVNLNGKSAA